MIVLLAILAGVAGAVVGYAVTAVLAVYIMGYYGVSDFEGGRGMLAFLGIGPIGGFITMIVAIVLVARYRKDTRTLGKTGGIILASLVGIGVLAWAGTYVLEDANPWITTNAPSPRLTFEIRLPAGQRLPDSPKGYDVQLDTDKNTMPANPTTEWMRMDGDRPVLLGNVDVAYRTSKRLLVLKLPGQSVRLFNLKLAANPSHMADFGPWQRVDFVDDPSSDKPPQKAPATDTTELRYRLERFDR